MPVDEQRTIEIDGRRFAWRMLGEGAPLLLVNGYAASSADWDPALLTLLARSFELICPDNRGTGGSELGDADELTVGAMAVDLERLLDALELERAAVAGWSMGGYVSQRLALRAPARVSALTLLASAPAGPSGVLGEPAARRALVDHSGTPREQARSESTPSSATSSPPLAPRSHRRRSPRRSVCSSNGTRRRSSYRVRTRRRCSRSAAARTSCCRPRTARRSRRSGRARVSS
jgi:pimeloyl-ACP methyl ester carboxylesterase